MTQIAPHKIGFVSLGCPKATVDSELIITRLRSEGYDIVADHDSADMVIVNTCGFIDEAVTESLDAIDEALHENGKVIVTGCLGAKSEMIHRRFPELLAITGPHATTEVMQAVHQHLPAAHDPFVDLVPKQGVKLTPQHYAYLKISEGCNHHCSFCIIPSFRGNLVSRPIDQVMQEAQHLVDAGVKEILVISQDTSAYGVDLRYRPVFWQGQALRTQFIDLAKSLGQLGVWVRLHYVYPYPHVDEVIPLMAQGLILPYLDIPFQHASPRILKLMKRPGNRDRVLERIQGWREICPELVIRSTFIVGFPGETESDFEQLLDFIEQAQLDRVGCFRYSAVEGATANQLPDPVDEAIKQQRYDRFMQRQQEVSAARLRRRIGQTMQVLIESRDEECWIGRSYADAPEIDGLIIIDSDDDLKIGELYSIEITETDCYDCYGVPAW
ncbi:MAG: 30S ribosomal protein S12 methylthiotransferase RimO [Gammaproteobacteria bacterium]|nr:30S ribosomal protein S12 methylthiotransferase RimO [Gammaproteobacteria bacterium]